MNKQTFSLKISFPPDASESSYENIKSYLASRGFEEFSEGYVDVDIMPDELSSKTNYFSDKSYELELFRYNQEELQELKTLIVKDFADLVNCNISSFLTADWQEAWKDSFKPIETDLFYIYPPWEKENKDIQIPIKIEPGMAFGTGQHQTTMLCLKSMEKLAGTLKQKSFIDIGTGTGILAIAAKKLGCEPVVATDIEQDAISACHQNQKLNGVSFKAIHTSTPKQDIEEHQEYFMVVANILANTIIALLDELHALCEKNGYLLLSGILSEQSQDIVDKASHKGFTLEKIEEEDSWVAILLKKNE